jgi:DNA-binding beta-propeller fold protein YncE
MLRTAVAALAMSAALAAPASAADYKIVDRIKMADGYWDYGAFDAGRGRVLWTRDGVIDAIDVKTGKVTQIKNSGDGHVAVPVAGTTLVVLPLRMPARTVRIFDTSTEKVVADLPGGDFPDGATYDPFSKHAFVADRNSSQITEVDAQGGKATTFAIGGGKLEFPASDGRGHVFVVVQEPSNELAVVDVKAQKVTGHYKTEGCEDGSGLAYADKARLLIVACGNGVAKVLAADTGKEVATIPIGKGPDSVLYDPQRQLAFIPCGRDGVLEVISVGDRAHVAKMQSLPTHVLVRTGAVDPQTGRLYLMSADPDPSKPAGGGGRPTPMSGTFEVLVVGQQ